MALPPTKKRCLDLEQQQSVNQSLHAALNWASFQSRNGHKTDVCSKVVPAPMAKRISKPKHLKNPTFVVFDLETTGLIRGKRLPQITQIAASNMSGSCSFSQYILPTEPISASAKEVTGLSVVGDQLLHHGEPVEATDLNSAIQLFYEWLKEIPDPVLIAHNGKNFDFPVFVNALNCCNAYGKFAEIVKGFVDSVPLFKAVIPGRKSYKQVDIVYDLMETSYGAHDAIEDVHALRNLINHLGIENKIVLSHKITMHAVCSNMKRKFSCY